VNRRWQRLALQLTRSGVRAPSCNTPAAAGSPQDGWRWLPRDAATEGWALEVTRYACHEAPGAEGLGPACFPRARRSRAGASPATSGALRACRAA
jgi:hypothetical protein